MGARALVLSAPVVALCALVMSCGGDDKKRVVLPRGDAGVDAAEIGAGGAPPAPADASTEHDVPPPPDAAKDAPAEAAIPLNGVFVNPALGLDTNSGEQTAPFKTIAQAIKVATAGQSVYLEDGTYDDASQTTLNFNVPAGVTIQGRSPTGVKIASTIDKNEYVFTFLGAGGIHDVWFQDVAGGVTCHGTGTFAVSNVHFSGVIRPFFFSDSVEATVDATSPDPIFTNVPVDSIGVVAVELSAHLTFTGGDIENVTTSGTGIFFVRGDARLDVVGTTMKAIQRRALVHYDNAVVTMTGVTMQNITWTSSGIENSVIYMGAHQVPQVDASIELVNTSITDSGITAIGISAGNTAYHNLLKLTNSHVDRNKGRAITIQSFGSALPNIEVQSTGNTFDGNTLDGIYAEQGSLQLSGGSISGNGGSGLVVNASAVPTSVNLRGVAIGNNTASAVLFTAPAGSTLDLGTQASPGSLVFTQVAASPNAAVNLQSPIAGTAIGNTWIPNVQGASGTGKFTTPTSFAASTAGNNVTTGVGASLVVF